MIFFNPWGGCKFILRSKNGGLVKIYDHHIRPDSVYKSILISSETTVSETLRLLWSCYPQLDCQHLCLFEYCPDQDFETIINGDQCLLGLVETWEEGIEHKFVIKVIERDKEAEYDCKNKDENIEDNLWSENQRIIVQQSVRKKNFLRTMIGELSESDDTILSRTGDICIDDDTDSVESELSISDEEDDRKHLKVDSMSTSEGDDLTNESPVMIDSFFT